MLFIYDICPFNKGEGSELDVGMILSTIALLFICTLNEGAGLEVNGSHMHNLSFKAGLAPDGACLD